jgi:cell volume regulation protein A
VDVEQLNLTLLVAAAVVLVAIGAVRLAARIGFPTLLAYLALGLVLGESVIGIRFDNADLAQGLGFVALVVILIEGGLTTPWRTIRPALSAAALLATVGVVVSTVVTGLVAALVLQVDVRIGLLCGALLATTDAAAVFATLRRLRLPGRLTSILEAESGFNDAPVVLLVLALSSDSHHPVWLTVLLLPYELLVGLAVGAAVGGLGVLLLRRQALPASGLYPLAVVGFAVAAYAGAAVIGASGFLAVYVAALLLGNADLPHRPAVRSFSEGLGWLAQIGLFVMLGLLASPPRLPSAVLPAVAVGLALLLVARPLAVALSVLPLRLPLREQAFLSWAGLRGAVPIVLATIPLRNAVPNATRLFDLIFVLVIVFTLVQAPTLPWVARRLGLTSSAEPADLAVEIAPLNRLDADLVHLRVPDRSRLNMVETRELRLPPGAGVLLVIRGGSSVIPEPGTRIRSGDELLVIAPAAHRRAVERRLRLVHESGRLARGWYGDADTEEPRVGGWGRVTGFLRRPRRPLHR